MRNSILFIQRHVRRLIDVRYKHSLFITIINLSKHLKYIDVSLKPLMNIANTYIEQLDVYMTKSNYEKIWNDLENLRKNHGGYHSIIFKRYEQIGLFDLNGMWEEFLHTCFVVTGYKPCSGSYFKPVFNYSNISLNDSIDSKINLKWKGHELSGRLVDDHLHMFCYYPLFSSNRKNILKSLNSKQSKLYRICLFPYFLCSYHTVIQHLKEDFDKLIALYDNILSKPISSISNEFIQCSTYERYHLIYLFSLGDEKKIFISMLLYTIVHKDSQTQANVILKKLPINIVEILDERLNIAEDKLSNIVEEYDEKSYEIRICALDASESVKKIAIEKLREIQSKPADISKPQLFLDKLLDIPFGIYRIESQFKVLKLFLKQIQYFTRNIESEPLVLYPNSWIDLHTFFETNNELAILNSLSNEETIKFIKSLKYTLQTKSLKYKTESGEKKIVSYTNKKLSEVTANLQYFFDKSPNKTKKIFKNVLRTHLNHSEYYKYINKWENVQIVINDTQKHVNDTLNNAIYGQYSAKRGIEQIICEWITGNSKRGYCFGFDGPPGVGKTSLAKDGLSKCLIDTENVQRPFFLIALGGSTHGSSLEGYGYTYASSTCGKIVNTLIQAKCMNPIIFFDELDKISNTPQGQEITGILVHLTDPTQNCEFIDKYFDGVPIDLSHVLFVFSYNDASKVDPILLDRIHSIKFESFGTNDKMKICRNYLLPELYKKLGLLETTIIIPNKILETVIEKYTSEAGVRKLKQILSTILRELNIRVLRREIDTPVTINEDLLESDLLNDVRPLKPKKIMSSPTEGTATGLFAITSGGGGILHIEIKHSHNNKDCGRLELTGNLGKIMQESISVVHTAIWSMLSKDKLKKLNIDINPNSNLHLHCAETATPKDGPSAGVAISVAMISCILKTPVKNNIAFTGEIDLNGNVHAVGGIKEKMRGAFVAGITVIFCPIDNKHDVKQINRETDSWIEMLDIQFIRTILDLNFLRESFVTDITDYLKNDVYTVIKPSTSPVIKSSKSAPQLNTLTNINCIGSPAFSYDERYCRYNGDTNWLSKRFPEARTKDTQQEEEVNTSWLKRLFK